jgi:hypothetical protein
MMKSRKTISVILCCLMTAMFVLSGCGAGDGPDDVPLKLEPAGNVISKYSKDDKDYASMPEEPTKIVRLHYRRTDDTNNDRSSYQAWNVWAWDMTNGGNGAAYEFTGYDDYGVYADLDLNVMNYMETMRYELANNDKKSCTSIHLTGDESFMKVKVYIIYTTQKYSGDEKEREEHSFTISTWVSDMILTKYYIQEQDKIKQNTNAVNVQGRLTAIMHVLADSPFEYDEDKSPIDIYETTFDKGTFVIYRLGASAAEKEGKEEENEDNKSKGNDKKGNDQEMKSNFEERSKTRQVLIWEGESTNWVQALQDSYERYLIEDGEKPKKAKEKAKDKAKDFKKEQTLKK